MPSILYRVKPQTGLHVSVFGMSLYRFLRKIGGSLRLSGTAALLAVLLYGDDRGKDALYGPRDDRLLEQIGLPSSYDHLYVWLADETADGKGGYIRMFADKGSIPYYARRDGSGYVSSGFGLIRYKSKFGFQTTRPNAEAPSVICIDRSRD